MNDKEKREDKEKLKQKMRLKSKSKPLVPLRLLTIFNHLYTEMISTTQPLNRLRENDLNHSTTYEEMIATTQ